MNTNQFQSSHNSSFRIVASAAALLFCVTPIHAQSPPPAPLPAQLATAKTVFVANAGSTPSYPLGATLVYNSVYNALNQAHLYSLTTNPTNVDLILEVSYIGWFGGKPESMVYTQLVVRDAKTQSLLWTISEPIGTAFTQKSLEKNISDSAAKLVADLATLVNGNTVSPNSTAPTKTRLSDEGSK